MSLYQSRLPLGITSRIIAVNDLDIHILEALPRSATSDSTQKKLPLILLLHGFPELAFSWRKVMVPLSQAGFHVVAPDQRGFGQTKLRIGIPPPTSPPPKQILYEDDLAPYRMLNLTADIVALVYSLGYTSVQLIVGHDFGSPVAGYCALIRPDIFKRVAFISAPFTGPPSLDDMVQVKPPPIELLNQHLSELDPPRKHYTMYFSSREANSDMCNPPGGLHTFLRTYYHVKSADWEVNDNPAPHSLLPFTTVSQIAATLPHYYIMPLSSTMPSCIAPYAPSPSKIAAANTWLTEEELEVYTEQYMETGFQGGLNWYRCQTDLDGRWTADLRVFARKGVEVPGMFVAGKMDWGTYQIPGALEGMRSMLGGIEGEEEDFVLVERAGHWVQQERPDEVVRVLLEFLKRK